MADNTELRRWALEQAIKLHGANGSTASLVMSDAENICAWVDEGANANPSPVNNEKAQTRLTGL